MLRCAVVREREADVRYGWLLLVILENGGPKIGSFFFFWSSSNKQPVGRLPRQVRPEKMDVCTEYLRGVQC